MCFGQIKMDYTARFTDAQNHYVEVQLNCENLSSETTDFMLPVWSPGYYQILDFPKNIVDFSIKNTKGDTVKWSKKSKNHWVVENKADKHIIITYRYFANQKSVAESNVNETRAFIMPNNMFMHIKGHIDNPVKLSLYPNKSWKTINTGLKKIEKEPHVFYAENFDVLYDSPIYMGNPYSLNFQHEGKYYDLSIANPEGLNDATFINDLKRIISASTSMMQHVPYDTYSFIFMEAGGGGLEHWNSQAVFTSGSFNFTSNSDYVDFLNFITHEYFHLYNVKAIRPFELGPFDYSRENYTNMLWVSEGLTVYYEYIIMMKAGLLKSDAALKYLSDAIGKYENTEGKNHMTLARSSFDIWLNFFNKNSNAREATISYYNKGPIVGFLLDLKIRNSTKNNKSLDDVMRFLYNQYYLKENRGFKEEEFWLACETISGDSMEDIKEYVYSVKEIDYQKYLDYAALQVDMPIMDADTNNSTSKKRAYRITEKGVANKLQSKIRTGIFSTE